jgi:hypothetical protein
VTVHWQIQEATAFENRLIAEQQSVHDSANALFDAGRADLATAFLTDYCMDAGREGLLLGNALLGSIEARTAAIFGYRTPQTDVLSELDYQQVTCRPAEGRP